MKKIIYGCLIALLSINFGCEKDEISNVDQVENSDTQQEFEKQLTLKEQNSISNKGTEAKGYGNQQQINYLILEPVPFGTETMDVYLNMTKLEAAFISDPNNPAITDPFNVY
jgi:hypothetical protein